ncbi:glutathione S-transferase [Sphaerosporella brunnea]|uniref:Glutathione S-transferase n=1 Tax=Sphaerosporella brunnea TaxID=1250544 RepID=A0A5J5F170_9PEZI|nr:glutathione S-transferase [Sphaerosporella brunnea]
MAPFASIYSWPNNPRLLKTLAAANINGLSIELPPFKFGETNKDPAWLSKFPLGKVPALETHGDAPVYVAESAAIAHFVADSGPAREQLLGSTPAERAKIQQWIFHAETELTPQVMVGIRPRIGRGEYDAEAETKAIAAIDRVIAVVEEILGKEKWLVGGEKLSMADLAVATCLQSSLKVWLGREWREKWPRTIEWYEKTIESDGVKEAWGPKVYVD